MSSTQSPIPSVPPVDPALRIFGGLSYLLFAGSSLIAYIALATILARINKRSAFFLITWQLVLCDALTQVVQLVVAVPNTLAGELLYSDDVLHAFSMLDTVAYYGAMTFALLMTIDRATVFFFHAVNGRLFETPTMYWTLLATWAIALVAPASLNLSGCYKSFAAKGVFHYNDCVDPVGLQINQVWAFVKTYGPPLMLVMYLAIYAKLWHMTRSGGVCTNAMKKSAKKREQKLLLQSLLICGSMEIENVVFNYLVKFLHPEGQWIYFLFYFQNWIKILNSTLTAVILFAFNGEVRSRFLALVRYPRRSSAAVMNVTGTSSETARREQNPRRTSSRF